MIDQLHTLTLAATNTSTDLLAAVPDPGQGTEPPGAAAILTVLSWLAWAVFAACVAGVLVVAIKLALAFRRGEGGEAVGQLGWVLGAAIIGSSAAAIIGLVLV
jgi:hypothetical protein